MAEHLPDPESDEAAEDPGSVGRAHVEHFQAWMVETRSGATALNKHKGLQQFFRWLRDDEEDIGHSPMDRVKKSRTTKKLIPVIRDDDTVVPPDLDAWFSAKGLLMSFGLPAEAGAEALDSYLRQYRVKVQRA
ncbi:hypothetical protein [Actinosynnema sp. NPDC020468]|uniref:hypothetical protein n=1 Tax=Actinosynnema sp. NPDC020468 TaxID=3154488 RepID=UPI0033C3C791